MEREMNKIVKVAVIIPCYNEQDNVFGMFSEIKNAKYDSAYFVEPIFINDCSTDNTKQILVSNNIHHLSLPVNLGIGGAVQTGFKYALRNGFDIAIQMDGDGQHPPCELEKIISPLLNNQADVVIGSRYISNEGFQSSWLRRVGINYFKWLNKKLVGVIITDSTSGYRAINHKALQVVSEYYPDEYPEPEAIVLFVLNNLKIQEVPVIMRERQGGKSSIRAYKTVYYMFKVTLGTIFLYIRLKFNGKRHTI
jgi:glycosyltransferase involved in cell wall biosynthesis